MSASCRLSAPRRADTVASVWCQADRSRGAAFRRGVGWGNDWQTVRTDGATTLNVRLVLKTKDEALIGMTYSAIRHGPPDVVARIEKGEVVDPTSYYFRLNPLFETANANYDWLNRVVAVGSGHRRRTGRFIASLKFSEWRRLQFEIQTLVEAST